MLGAVVKHELVPVSKAGVQIHVKLLQPANCCLASGEKLRLAPERQSADAEAGMAHHPEKDVKEESQHRLEDIREP